jgi:hypothetical protein
MKATSVAFLLPHLSTGEGLKNFFCNHCRWRGMFLGSGSCVGITSCNGGASKNTNMVKNEKQNRFGTNLNYRTQSCFFFLHLSVLRNT